MKRIATVAGLAAVLAVTSPLWMRAQRQPPSAAQAIRGHFVSVNQQILEMARDFPDAKYSFRATPEVRSFSEVIVHVLSGNVYAARAGRGEKVQWDEVDAKAYKTKADVVRALEKSIEDATATLKGVADDRLASTPEPWLSVVEHSAEHYGQLVVYYRVNGLVPPASRPKK
jgi:uncharacterized damage-inducible protein DinB